MPAREYSGIAVPTTTTSSVGPDGLSVTIADPSGWPDGSTGKFPVVFARGTSAEETALANGRTGTTVSFESAADRGTNGTTAASHPSGTTIEHVATVEEFQESNAHINSTNRDDHTQYHNDTRGDARYPRKTLWGDTGSLVVASGENTPAELAVGDYGQILVADDGAALGVKWTDPPEASITKKGDLLAGNGPGSLGVILAGTHGQVLTADSSAGVAWKSSLALPLARVAYSPTSEATSTITSASFADIDASNLAVTFTYPFTGAVIVYLQGYVALTGGGHLVWGLRSGTSQVGEAVRVIGAGGVACLVSARLRVTGTAGQQATLKWAWRLSASPPGDIGTMSYGGQSGPAVMEVYAA